MKKCQDCNTYVKDDAHFCTNCGSSSLETIDGVLEEATVVKSTQEDGVVVQYVVKGRSLKESIENFRLQILNFLRSYRVTEILLEWAGFFMCLAPAYEVSVNFPKLGLFNTTVHEWMSIFSIVGILFSLVDLKHGAFAFLFATRGADILITEIRKIAYALHHAKTYDLNVFELYSLPAETVGSFIFIVVLFSIAFTNYKRAKGGY